MSNLNYDIATLIKEEHQHAELARLNAGMEGCGCADCREFYKTIDLTRYGSRVKTFGDYITISGVKAQKERDLNIEGTDNEPQGAEINLPLGTTPEPIMKQARRRGRPSIKQGQAISRTTKWRQNKRGQGVLI